MNAHPIEFLDLLNGQVQFVVPRWQRRYCWNQSDIERLVDDLTTIADAGPNATHYGGTLLTFPEPGAAGVVKVIRVVDGQQRLTTVSILLGCIAEKLGPKGQCGEWTAEIIRDDRLTNPRKPTEKLRKLRLQTGDEEEYRLGLEGYPAGSGAVAQAWKTTRRLVARNDVAQLLKGLRRFRVVSIGLTDGEDPQQIFESLNATGRPLTESEKVKNWLLMGLTDKEQQDLHDNHWKRIEKSLGAVLSTEPADTFLRDVLRWWTGEVQGINRVYETLRRWAVKKNVAGDRPDLCREFSRLADLYGIITGTAGSHFDANVERELRHLREMGIDTHRPLTLRLLNDAARSGADRATMEELANTLAGIGAWTTRLWLADRRTAGMNRAVVELAHGPGPQDDEDWSQYWHDQICRLRNTRVGVPDNEDVREGIRTRKAYGGSATQSSFAVLCALMEAEHREESPARDRLTVEHVMPRKLTDEWRRALGADAEEIHGRNKDRLANLTLSGDITNSELGAGAFDTKRDVYRKSPIGMTRRLACEFEWGSAAIERRAETLAKLALIRWPWQDRTDPKRAIAPANFRWRVGIGEWNEDIYASQMVSKVAGAVARLGPRKRGTTDRRRHRPEHPPFQSISAWDCSRVFRNARSPWA